MDFSIGTSEASNVLHSLLNKEKKNVLLNNSTVIYDRKFTLSNGERITIKPKNILMLNKERDIVNDLINGSKQLECLNMNELYEKIRIKENTEKELSKLNENEDELKKNINELKMLTSKNNKKHRKKNQNTLWTEKYRPKKFIDLLGNERVNANILKWLNEWMYIVNGGKIRLNDINNNNDNNYNNDPFKRPRKKMILIHGPPGIGKTTIAQCVCKQLNFEIQEINSSDDRSGVNVREKVKNSLKMRSLTGKNICLVLDEIDGAMGSENGIIKILVNLLQKDKKVVDELNNFGKLKYNKMDDLIKRPIIAMCNDIGSNCLEQLKPFCEIINFQKSNKKHIKKRLKEILKVENIEDVNESLLDDLIISLDGDIRNCINFLQFNSKDLNNNRIKDGDIIWFKIIKEIFNLENKFTNNKIGKNEIFNKLREKLNKSNNNLNKINMGCFNLLLQVHEEYEDDLNKLDKISEWNYFQDLINLNNQKMMQDESNTYNSIVSLKYFQEFSNFNSNGGSMIGFNNNHYNNNNNNKFKYQFKSEENFDVKRNVNSLINNMIKKYQGKINHSVMVNSEISMLNSILIPNYEKRRLLINNNNSESDNISNNNSSINSGKEFDKERVKIDRIIEIMKQFEIKIEKNNIFNNNNNNGNNGGNIRMKPDIIEGLIDIDKVNDSKVEDINERWQIKKLEVISKPYLEIINGIMEQRMRKRNIEIERERERDREIEEGGEDNSNSNKRHKIGDGIFKDKDSVDFQREYNNFGGDKKDNKGEGKGKESKEERIWVKYHEGFSNAVRKEITWSELLK
ncbi:Ctf18 protein [Pichia kluyveri]|uniref:Ctf18 protein n=1 Tax=Pichia kluyveri TaxID=36015 RepID=A0AAV5R0Y1_PICKL|nr:Ctf18 protein [Pichia kluyveri]